jgi:hypothetical protein
MFKETIFYSETASQGMSFGTMIGLILLGCFVVILIVIAFVWLKNKLARPELYGMTREQVQARWQKILETSRQGGDMGLKLSVIEADNLLDAALKSLVIPGDTLGERLKVAGYNYPKLKNVWWAHKLRNNIVHDHAFQLRNSEARRALSDFESALKELRVM